MSSTLTVAQTITMNNSSISTCNSTYTDPGGNYNYLHNQNITQTISPTSNADKIQINFHQFSTDSCCDYLVLYDGNSINSPVIDTLRGNVLHRSIRSTAIDGSLTLRFISDSTLSYSGWNASISCVCDTSKPYVVSHSPISGTPICQSNPAFVLTGGNPSGGIYSGNGIISNDTFVPNIVNSGLAQITYSHTSPGGCTGDTTIEIPILPYVIDSVQRDTGCVSYVWRGRRYRESGIYRDTIPSLGGLTCDTISIINLTILGSEISITGIDSIYCDTINAVTVNGTPSNGFLAVIRPSNPNSPSFVSGNQFSPRVPLSPTITMVYLFRHSNSCIVGTPFTIKIKGCNHTSINKNQIRNAIKIYPNPFTGELFIEKENNIPAEVVILDNNGKILSKTTINNLHVSVDLSYLNNGIYYAKIINGHQIIVKKIILMK
jgi:hypothetical protein